MPAPRRPARRGPDEKAGMGINLDVLGGLPKARRRVKVAKGDDGMNKTERAYSRVLDDRKHAGEVWDWLFDAVNWRIGDRCFYKPDFLVYLEDGSLEVHETKGFMEDDALVKIRAFLDKFHIPLVVVRRRGGAWDYERLEPREG